MLESVRVAAVAVDTKPGQTDANLEKLDAWTAKAVDAGVRESAQPRPAPP